MVLEVRINIILGGGGSRWWLGDSPRVISGCMYVFVAQSCPTLCDPVECSLQGSSFRGIFQARILEWVAISFSRGSSQPRDRTWVSRFAGRFFTNEPLGKPWPSKGPVILWGLLLHCQTPLARQGSLMWGSELSLLWENFSNNSSAYGLPMWPVWDLILSSLHLFYHLCLWV